MEAAAHAEIDPMMGVSREIFSVSVNLLILKIIVR
jgi:hypothetical protein